MIFTSSKAQSNAIICTLLAKVLWSRSWYASATPQPLSCLRHFLTPRRGGCHARNHLAKVVQGRRTRTRPQNKGPCFVPVVRKEHAMNRPRWHVLLLEFDEHTLLTLQYFLEDAGVDTTITWDKTE